MGVQAQHRVTFSSQSLCAVTRSTVKIPCTYPNSYYRRPKEWYRVQSSEGEPRDLRKDPQYSGRVSVSTETSDCELTVRNVRASDSGVYNFRFKTWSNNWISAPSGVHLTVTDLQVKVDPNTGGRTLSCITTCTLSNNPTYIWYKNGQRVTDRYINELDVKIEESGSYTCAVRGHEELRSPAVCVFDEKSCWSVTYSTQNICSLIGSSVDIHSYYTFPDRSLDVKETDTPMHIDIDCVYSDLPVKQLNDCVFQGSKWNYGRWIRKAAAADPVVEYYRGDAVMLIRTRHFSAAAILMLLAGVQAQHRVTLSSQSLCVVTGSTVKIPCMLRKPYYSSVRQREWYRVQSSEGEPRDLSKDPQYSGRVSVSTETSDCELTVRNVRASDSGVYNFRFKTQSSDWISAPSGVHLTVTDLKVTVSDWRKKLSCITTCTLSNNPTYIWYKNGQRVTDPYRNELYVSSWESGSYSCAVGGHEELRSPAVCVFDEKSCWSVTYSTQTICSLIGSSVDIHSYYTFPNRYKVTEVFWFIKEQAGVEPVDVREDEEYRGRVQYTQISQNNCRLRITNLREKDAQTYRFRFYTDDATGKYTGQPGVFLSVTDLKVTVSDSGNWNKKLSCITTCTLSNNPTYIWYKNGQRVTNPYRNELYVSSGGSGSYSCAVGGHEELRSPAVCVFDQNSCWSVTYSSQTICALIGSSVDIHGYYTFPEQSPALQPVWHIMDRELSHTDEKVEFLKDRPNRSTLRLKNLTEMDSTKYHLLFKATYHKQTYGSDGVYLSLTGLQVKVAVSYLQSITLICITTCTLSNNPTYIWYKNGQRVSKCKSASCSVAAVGGAVSYSCAVEGHDSLLSPPVYSPKNTSTVVLSSGDTVEGDSVTLSCSSDANPPVLTYSWFKQRAAADTLLTTGQNYSISTISSQHSGLYYCTAHNQLGQHNSTPTLLDVLYSPKNTSAVVLSSGDTLEGDSVTLSCSSDANPPVLTYSWFKQRAAADTLLTTGQNYSISNISSQHSGLYYCTAHNQLGQHNSTPTLLDVLYSPRNTSVTVVPSVSGDLVTLLCRSDSNPNSSYTWYKKTEGDVILIENGTNLTLSSRADGFYYCTARNGFGSSNSSEWPCTSDNSVVKYAVSGVTVALVLLVLLFIAVFLWIRRRASLFSNRSEDYSKNNSAPVYGNVSAMTSDPTQTASSEDQDNVQYSSVYFRNSHTQEVPLYSTVQLTEALKQEEEVEYATVSLAKSRAVPEDEIYNNLKSNQ
ncbi:sialoadhesin [Ictalurus furcatus]|uniref:sialoadhesin n=1 Tax=Ictalurus furcatus TaxID=66913 RepID=UPI0023505CA1|nr:sialoadhesin [Ictalurus furcatus]